jgi:ABC-type antimicrobial peptide transport system permease subunit
MTFKAFKVILIKQFQQKWGRVLLSSAGIIIGIWAITATTGITFGIRKAIITGINSQPVAREIRLWKQPGDLRELNFGTPPKFIPISKNELQDLQKKNSDIIDYSPVEELKIVVEKPKTRAKCLSLRKSLSQTFATQLPQNQPSTTNSSSNLSDDTRSGQNAENMVSPAPTNSQTNSQMDLVNTQDQDLQADALATNQKQTKTYFENCLEISVFSESFKNFYESNKDNWYGQTKAPGKNEIVACTTCSNLNLMKFLQVEKPEDMLGKEIKLYITNAPDLRSVDKVIDVTRYDRDNKETKDTKKYTFKIVSVIDDSKGTGFSFNAIVAPRIYLDFSYFEQASKKAMPGVDLDKYGYIESLVVVSSFDKLDEVSDFFKAQGYTPASPVQILISALERIIIALTGALSILGLVALMVSVFSIILVMIISVLERRKEVGILKSIGASNGDIFWLFLIESFILGLIGWLIGTGLALLTSVGITSGISYTINLDQFEDIKSGLQTFGIETLSAEFPWLIFVITFILSIIVTTLSGILPAIQAARQNPVEVLRSE